MDIYRRGMERREPGRGGGGEEGPE